MTDTTALVEKKDKLDKDPRETILKSLLEKFGTPDNMLMAKVIPVFANRYRVNIWVSTCNDLIRNQGRIERSYFVELRNNKIRVH